MNRKRKKYLLKLIIVIFAFTFFVPYADAQSNQGQQQITLNEQQLKDLLNNPALMQQYGVSKEQLLQLAAQNGININDADNEINPKQLKNLSGKSENSLLRNGNKEYENQDFVEAEINYRKSLEKNPERVEGLFNLGNALYAQNRYDEAFEKYNDVASIMDDKSNRAEAFHNLGNSYLNSQKVEEAIDAFKNALKLNPEDEDSRYNLAYANYLKKKNQKKDQDKDCNNPNENEDKEEKKEKKEKKDKEENKKEDKEKKEEKEEQKDKEKKEEKDEEAKNDKEKKEEQEQKDKEQNEEQAKEEEKKEKEKQEQKKPEDQKPEDQQKQEQQVAQAQLSKQEAERLLEALENEEKKVQQKLLKKSRPAVKRTIEKDW